MDTGTGKAIEAIVILGLVLGFYFQQQAALKRSKSDAPRRDESHAEDAKTEGETATTHREDR